MKRTKKIEPKWYLVYDGKNHKIVKDLSEYDDLNVVIIDITAEDAASYLLLQKENANK